MKIEPQKPKATFNPLVLTLETPEEVAALFALINHSDLSETVGVDGLSRRMVDVNRESGNSPIGYQHLHSALCKIIKTQNT